MSILEVFLAGAGRSAFNFDVQMTESIVLHRIAICLGLVDYNQAISGKEVLELLEKWSEEEIKKFRTEDDVE